MHGFQFMKSSVFQIVLLLNLVFISAALAKPLEGRWKNITQGSDLELKSDDSFIWGSASGKWIYDGGRLYLHSPGKLVSYTPYVEEKILVLTGGDLRGGEIKFRWNSEGTPFQIPFPDEPADVLEVSPQSQATTEDEVTSTESLSAKITNLVLSPICGTWVSTSRIGYLDTLRIHLSGELRLSDRGIGVYKQSGDRLYVRFGNEDFKEWYILQDEYLLAINYDRTSGPRSYIRVQESHKQFRPSHLISISGRYVNKRRTTDVKPGSISQKYYRDVILVDPDNRIHGYTLDSQGDSFKSWSGRVSAYANGYEIRYDDGNLETVESKAEIHPKFGRLFLWDETVYIIDPQLPKNLDTRENLHPVDASRVRRDLADELENARDKTRDLMEDDVSEY